MKLKEMSFDQQVEALKTALRSGRNSFASYLALFALRHHLATKHAPDYSVRPVLRWYLGQLAKEYIGKYYNEASRGLEGFAEIGLLEASEGQNAQGKEYRLEEALYPALLAVLEEVFGKEYIANAIARAKFYRNPGQAKERPHDKGLFGGERMKGEIEKIWKNNTSDGRRYNVLQIGGERYSLWEEDYLDKLQEGQVLEFDFRESGEFKNISRIYEPETANGQPGNESKEELPLEYNGPQAKDQKTKQIIRMSSLRSASRILGGSRIPAGKRAEKTIEIAKKFEKYIDDGDLADQENEQKP